MSFDHGRSGMPSTETAFRLTLLLLAGLGLYLVWSSFFRIRVPSGSMLPLIQPGDCLLVRRVTESGTIRRGDLLVFRSTARQKGDGSLVMIKRLIGLPGETVDIRQGKVFINDIPLNEPYIKGHTTGEHRFHIPLGSCLFLGDNREGSHDARVWQEPFVRRREIMGKVILRFRPIRRMGYIK